MQIAFFRITVYGKDGYEKEHFDFRTKAEQLSKYYALIAEGYKRDDLEKQTFYF